MLADSGRASDPSPSPPCAQVRVCGDARASLEFAAAARRSGEAGTDKESPDRIRGWVSPKFGARQNRVVTARAVEERSVALHLSRLPGYVRLHCPHPLFELHPLRESSRLLPLHLCRFHAGQRQQVNYGARQAAAYFARLSASCRPSVCVRLHRCSLHVPMVCPFLLRFNTPAAAAFPPYPRPYPGTNECALRLPPAVLSKGKARPPGPGSRLLSRAVSAQTVEVSSRSRRIALRCRAGNL